MKTRCMTGCALAALALMTGCLPEKRIVWSADGNRAVVLTDDGLRLMTPDGKLTDVVVPDARRAAWFPDNRRLLVMRAIKAANWAAIEAATAPADRANIPDLAASLRKQVLAHEGDFEHFDPKLTIPHTDGQGGAAAIYLRDKLAQGLAEKVGEKWKEIESMDVTLMRATIYAVDGDRVSEAAVLTTSFDDLLQPSVSPTGQYVGFERSSALPDGSENPGPVDLILWSVEDRAATPATMLYIAYGYDWSPDGRSVAVIHSPQAPSKSLVALGAVATVRILAEDGKPIPATSVHADDHVGMLFNQFGCVRWLADGRLIFAAHEATLPATEQEMPKVWSLFAWSPTMRAGTTRVLARNTEAEPSQDLAMFEVSPDGRRAVFNGGNGRVIVADLTTGESSMWFDTNDPDNGPRTMPTWRGNEEICAVVPPGSPAGAADRCSVILASAHDKFRALSGDWPKKGFGWLEPKPVTTSQSSEAK